MATSQATTFTCDLCGESTTQSIGPESLPKEWRRFLFASEALVTKVLVENLTMAAKRKALAEHGRSFEICGRHDTNDLTVIEKGSTQ
jgi:hypothetical protein